jgi:hypothetical protein
MLLTLVSAFVPMMAFGGESCFDSQTATGLSDGSKISVRVESVVKHSGTQVRNRRYATALNLKLLKVSRSCFSNVGDASAQAGQASAFGGGNSVIFETFQCAYNKIQGQTELNVIVQGQKDLGSEPTAALVVGANKPGTRSYYKNKTPLVIPMTEINAIAKGADQADESLVLAMTVQDYTPLWQILEKPVESDLLISDLKDIVQQDYLTQSTLKSVMVDGDQVNVRISWTCR